MLNSIGGAHRQVPSGTKISVRHIRIATFVVLAAGVTIQDKVAAHRIGPAAQDIQVREVDPRERVAELIDQFTVVSNFEIMYGNYIPGPMDPSGEYVRSLGQKPWRVEPGDCNEIIRELVSLGAASVPLLVQHLDDNRETKITLKLPGIQTSAASIYEKSITTTRMGNSNRHRRRLGARGRKRPSPMATA